MKDTARGKDKDHISHLSENDTKEDDLGPKLARVVRVEGCEITLDSSPLTASLPGFAGDRGTIEGVRVLDVDQQDDGVLHLLQSSIPVKPGQLVWACVDSNRRNRLARTRAACVLVQAILWQRSVPLVSIELTAGLAWLEINEFTRPIDLDRLVSQAIPLSATPLAAGLMTVECMGAWIDLPLAPIAKNSNVLAGAEVRTVASLDGARSALEIALPDAKGQWWR